MAEPILSARGLTKRYGRVTALDQCDFDLYPGEILAVIGDNGAGKSSLIKALSGAVQPDEGEITLDGMVLMTTSTGYSLTTATLQGTASEGTLSAAGEVTGKAPFGELTAGAMSLTPENDAHVLRFTDGVKLI